VNETKSYFYLIKQFVLARKALEQMGHWQLKTAAAFECLLVACIQVLQDI